MLLIIFLSVIILFFLFVVASFFLMLKDYKINADNHVFRVHNIGSKLCIYVDEKEKIESLGPNLIEGTQYKVEVEDNEYLVKCKTNKFGNVMRVEIYKDGKIIADNGKKLKENKKAGE